MTASAPLRAYGDSARGVMKKRASLVSTQPSCPWDTQQDPWGKLSLADQRRVLDLIGLHSYRRCGLGGCDLSLDLHMKVAPP